MERVIRLSEHLMDKKSFDVFCTEMWVTLEIKKIEKVGMRDWTPEQVWKQCVDELEKRLEIIKTQSPTEIEKQTIHVANFMYFLNRKMHELNNPLTVERKESGDE